jgi:hypothetical protein
MSCALYTFLGIYIAATGKANDWIVRSSLILASAVLVVAFYQAWAEQARKVDRLKSHADIHGKILDVCLKYPLTDFRNPVMVCASLQNESPEVSPTIREFVCRIETPEGTLTSRTAHNFATQGVVLSRSGGRGNEKGFINLALFNHQSLTKHNHREGWLLFMFTGLTGESLDGYIIRLFAIDGGDVQHFIGEATWPWPARNFRDGIADESQIPEDIE